MKNVAQNVSRFLSFSISLFLFALLTQSLTSCQQPTKVRQGSELYAAYCLMCHGETGVGDGAMADLLKNPPPDLTQIKERNGKFPVDQIMTKVAGKQDIVGHSASDMPVFWVAIKNGENLTDDHEVEERMKEIVAYLRSIQQ